MRIAVCYEDGQVFQHFGHTEQFKLYDAAAGMIVSEQIVGSGGGGHDALAGFLKAARVDALICGGVGIGARTALAEAGILLYAGVTGSADAAAKALAEGKLQYNPNVKCEHEHHCEGYDCGHHHGDGGCGGHHGEGHECGHARGEALDCGHTYGDEGCRKHHGS